MAGVEYVIHMSTGEKFHKTNHTPKLMTNDAEILVQIDDQREADERARYHVVICGLGRDCDTREAVSALLASDTGWQDEGEYATILDRETGEEFTT